MSQARHVLTALSVSLFLGVGGANAAEVTLAPLIDGVATVSYREGAAAATIVAGEIRFDPRALSAPSCAAGSALQAGTKSLQCALIKPGVLRLIVFGLDRDPVPEGEIARVGFAATPDLRASRYRLRLRKPTAANADGETVRLLRRNPPIRLAGARR